MVEIGVGTVFQVPSLPIEVPSGSKCHPSSRGPPQRSDSETSSTHMEVDEVGSCGGDKTANMDFDSGIENMEVTRCLQNFLLFCL